MPDDIGRFTGRYLQFLAVLAVAGMILSMFRGTATVDLSFILLFWAGAALIRHSRLGRTLVLLGAGFTCATAAIVMIVAGRGALETVDVRILGAPVADPSPVLVAALGASLLVAAAIPVALLLTTQARREFGVA